MPDIDVTDIILDSFVAGETFQIIRRTEAIAWNGRSVIAGKPFTVIGQVTPVGDNSLTRQSDFDIQAKTIYVITAFPLRGVSQQNGQNYKPDLVVWHGDQFLVKTVRDYSAYGQGMIQAECSSIDLTDQAPQ